MTDGGPLDERYFTWLYSQIGAVTTRNPSRNYWELARQLYTTEFRYFVPNDDNRAEDGRLLREEFLDASPFNEWKDAEGWLSLPCSFLEMLIALSRKLAFEAYSGHGEDATPDWFQELICNLDLNIYTDAFRDRKRQENIAHVLEVVNERQYDRNGVGGLFPLQHAREDQRRVEIWYQMAAYLDERLP